MLITEMNNISTLVLLASGACNLKCSYCHIHKNKSLIGIDKEIRDAWADGTYLKTIQEVFSRLGIDSSKIRKLELWGGETTLHLDVINPQIKELLKIVPNLNSIGFSSNFMTKTDGTKNFLVEVNKYVKPGARIWLQQSIDGPDGILTEQGHYGNWETYTKNYKELSEFLNTTRLDNLKNIDICMKPTLDRELYIDYFSNEDNLYNYIVYLNEKYNFLRNSFVNDKVRILMTNPRVAIPMLFTTEEAQKFARICESWYTLCDRFISKSTQPINPEFRKALFNTVPQYNNNGNLMRDMAAGCGKNVTELAFMPDGTITDCYTNYMQGREDYEAQCNDEDKITSRIYKNLNYNPLKCSDEEAVEQLWLNTICLKNAKSLKTTLGAGIVKELALSGQVPHKFLDRDLRLRGSRFSQCQSDCIVQNVITTRVPLLLNAGAYRLHLNGLFDLVEKDLKDR